MEHHSHFAEKREVRRFEWSGIEFISFLLRLNAEKIILMENICWGWRARSRIPRSLNHPWKIWTYPTSVCLYLFLLHHLFCEECCQEHTPPRPRQRLLIGKVHWLSRWTVIEEKISKYISKTYNKWLRHYFIRVFIKLKIINWNIETSHLVFPIRFQGLLTEIFQHLEILKSLS